MTTTGTPRRAHRRLLVTIVIVAAILLHLVVAACSPSQRDPAPVPDDSSSASGASNDQPGPGETILDPAANSAASAVLGLLDGYGTEATENFGTTLLSNYEDPPAEYTSSSFPHLFVVRRSSRVEGYADSNENTLSVQAVGANEAGEQCSVDVILQYDQPSPLGAARPSAAALRAGLGASIVPVYFLGVDEQYGARGYQPRIGVRYDDLSGQFVKTGRAWPDGGGATPEDMRIVAADVGRSLSCVEQAHERALEASGPPVLGSSRGSLSVGLGTVRPANISLGGASSSGIITDLRWSSWGGGTADGVGVASYAPPGAANAEARSEPASITASDLGVCNGRVAYRRLVVWFPQYGETPHEGVEACGP